MLPIGPNLPERCEGGYANGKTIRCSFSKILCTFVIQRQIKIMKRIKYLQPECDFESAMATFEIVCQSPVDGGLEGTKDEDWVI